ncbi:MAG: hypothetical protein KGO53_07375 [Alphaproteobacteria bacterium]|nr:hypothetical protein [Alphaproteobacteria bacterium]
MKHIGKSGALMAAAALGLAVAGAGIVTHASAAAEAKFQCIGVNSCKGHSECQTATSSCNGMNACKGQGWLSKTKAECESLHGKLGDPVKS